MDSFKHSKTNLSTTDNILQTPYSIYDPPSSPTSSIYSTLASLRNHQILCSHQEARLYVFSAHEAEILLPSWTLTEHGQLQGARHLTELLLNAIEAALSFSLASSGLVRVGSWTWLFSSSEDGGAESVELRLRARITEAGGLLTSVTTTPSDLSAACEDESLLAETAVLLSPSGHHAMLLPTLNTSSQQDQAAWKALVKTTLAAEAMSLDAGTNWLAILPTSPLNTPPILWPAHLCFHHAPKNNYAEASFDSPGTLDWRTLFTPSSPLGWRNPLAWAEESLTHLTVPTPTLVLKETIPSTAVSVPEPLLMTSPPFSQRLADHQAAALGIYPTPPDGLVQFAGHVAGVSAVVASAVVETEATSPVFERRESSDDGEDGVEDDLFGEGGGGEFGGGGGGGEREEEIGDEDFDFFNGGDEDESQGGVKEIEGDGEVEIRDAVADVEVIAETPGAMVVVEMASPPEVVAGEDEVAVLRKNDAEKPLSPFTIKETLLPPPVPASLLISNDVANRRDNGTFGPVAFRKGLDMGRRWSAAYGVEDLLQDGEEEEEKGVIMSLKRKRGEEDEDSESESDDEGFRDGTSESEADLPPRMPWDIRKRRRDTGFDNNPFTSLTVQTGHESNDDTAMREHLSSILQPASSSKALHVPALSRSTLLQAQGLSKLDLLYIAQLVAEQAVTCTASLFKDDRELEARPLLCALEGLARRELTGVVGSTSNTPLTSLALQPAVATQPTKPGPGAQSAKPTTGVQSAKPTVTNQPTPGNGPNKPPLSLQPSKPAQQPPPPRLGIPRLPPTRTNPNPEIVPLPPPYIRVKRGPSTYELLPPALAFWDVLSLAPISGSKNVRVWGVCPGGVAAGLKGLIKEIGEAWEGGKLGGYALGKKEVEEDEEASEAEDGGEGEVDFVTSVNFSHGDLSAEEVVGRSEVLAAYKRSCAVLGSYLAECGQVPHSGGSGEESTIVVYLLDPFSPSSSSTTTTRHGLCAAFWALYKAYRDTPPSASSSRTRSDLVLQILPLESVVAPCSDSMVMLSSSHLSALAKEIYDRCPPPFSCSSNSKWGSATSSSWLELAAPLPKKLGFTLSATPPMDLMQEGCALHLACVRSGDGEWIVARWMDGTGACSDGVALCLRGRTYEGVVREVWERVGRVMGGREVGWRVFVLLDSKGYEVWEGRCWRRVVGEAKAGAGVGRKGCSVTLLLADAEPEARVALACAGGEETGTGFLTPVSTPQATNSTTTAPTVSPIDSSHLSTPALPATPAPSDSAEIDPEAHLIDLTDESNGILYSPTSYPPPHASSLAHGALLKRGSVADRHMTGLGVAVVWTVHVRANGTVEEGGAKQAEGALREALRMFRGLSLLGRARGLDEQEGSHGGCVPVHFVAAREGAKGVSGLLG